MGKKVFWTIIILSSAFLLLTLGASYFALEPQDLATKHKKPPAPVAIKVNEAQKAEPPPVADTPNMSSALADLAPQNLRNGVQDVGGIGFGTGGSGPGITGGGGFGTGSAELMGEKTNMDRGPRPIFRSPPEFPPEARQKSVSGFVVVKILVSPNGGVDRAQVDEGVPKGFFEQAALEAVRKWKFEPAMIKGKVQAAWTTQKIKFELN